MDRRILAQRLPSSNDEARAGKERKPKKRGRKKLQKKSTKEFENMLLQSTEKKGLEHVREEKMRRKRERLEKQRNYNAPQRATKMRKRAREDDREKVGKRKTWRIGRIQNRRRR